VVNRSEGEADAAGRGEESLPRLDSAGSLVLGVRLDDEVVDAVRGESDTGSDAGSDRCGLPLVALLLDRLVGTDAKRLSVAHAVTDQAAGEEARPHEPEGSANTREVVVGRRGGVEQLVRGEAARDELARAAEAALRAGLEAEHTSALLALDERELHVAVGVVGQRRRQDILAGDTLRELVRLLEALHDEDLILDVVAILLGLHLRDQLDEGLHGLVRVAHATAQRRQLATGAAQELTVQLPGAERAGDLAPEARGVIPRLGAVLDHRHREGDGTLGLGGAQEAEEEGRDDDRVSHVSLLCRRLARSAGPF